MRKHLTKASSEMSRLALDAISATDRADVASATIRAGMAVEFALRATVATASPALLFIPRGMSDTTATAMVQAVRATRVDHAWLREQTSTDFINIRRIAAALIPELRPLLGDIERVANRRDAVTHMYVVEPEALRHTLISLARVVAVVLPRLKTSEERFWGGDRVAYVRQLTDEGAGELRARVADKIREAQVRFATMIEGLDPLAREHLISALETQGGRFMPPGPLQIFREPCPACSHLAEVLVKTEDDVHDVNALDFGDWSDGAPSTVFIPQHPLSVQVQCPVCGVRLSYAELVEVDARSADLERFELQPRPGRIEEYDRMLWSFEPDPEIDRP
ncbi:hypothetical protein ASF96_10505 [Microbacterium sp. Leaf179]|nr:hypothetical protein ASF96_10505 [Microbacterium sp. Leaf179]